MLSFALINSQSQVSDERPEGPLVVSYQHMRFLSLCTQACFILVLMHTSLFYSCPYAHKPALKLHTL